LNGEHFTVFPSIRQAINTDIIAFNVNVPLGAMKAWTRMPPRRLSAESFSRIGLPIEYEFAYGSYFLPSKNSSEPQNISPEFIMRTFADRISGFETI
jgi:hypothetical protein